MTVTFPAALRPATPTASGAVRPAGISDAAALPFEEDGLHCTSTATVADPVGAAEAPIYYTFRETRQTSYAIDSEWINGMLDCFAWRHATAHDSVSLLRAVIRHLLLVVHDTPWHVAVFVEHSRELPAIRCSCQTRPLRPSDLAYRAAGLRHGMIPGGRSCELRPSPCSARANGPIRGTGVPVG